MFSRNFELLFKLAGTDFKLRYYGSYMGFFWSILKPFLMFGVLYFVFSHIFSFDTEYFAFHLLLGIILFQFFSEASMASMLSLTSKSYLLKKISFESTIVVFSSILQSLFSFLIHLGIFLIFFWFTHTLIWYEVLLSFFYIALLSFFLTGFGFFTSILYVSFRDLNQIWEVLLQILFYLTPILYPLSFFPEKYHLLLNINPLAFVLNKIDLVLLKHTLIFESFDLYMSIFCILFSMFGFVFFQKYKKRVNEKL